MHQNDQFRLAVTGSPAAGRLYLVPKPDRERPRCNRRSEGSKMSPLIGYFDDPFQAVPAYDPGTEVVCVVCSKVLCKPMCTVSVAQYGATNKSYFFRAHKPCWSALSSEEQSLIESSIIDNETDQKETS